MKYRITVPNEFYDDEVWGVFFFRGVGETDNEQAVKYFRDNFPSYKIEVVEPPKQAPKKTPAPRKRKAVKADA